MRALRRGMGLKLRRAKRAAGSAQRDAGGAVGAVFGRDSFRGAGTVVWLHDQEEHERDDYERDHLVEEPSVSDHRRSRSLSRGQGGVAAAVQAYEHVVEVDPTQQIADRGHENVLHERVHYSRKSHTQNERYGEINDVSLDCEVPEGFEHVLLPPLILDF